MKNLLAMQETACNEGDMGSILRLGRSPGEGNGNSLPDSGLGSPLGRGAWQARVHGVTRLGHDLATRPPPPMKTIGLWASHVVLMVKNLSASLEDIRDVNLIMDRKGLWEQEMTPDSSILAWKIPWAEDPGELQSMECKELDTT